MADITGTSGADRIQGTLLQDLIMAGGGDDVVDADEGNDVVHGGEGNDQLSGGMGDDMLYGGKGNDRLSDGNGNDVVDGDSGDDVVLAGHGDDTYVGGTGFDTLDFSAAAQGMTVDVSKGTATGMGVDSVKGFEQVIGSGFDDMLKGSKNSDSLVGGDGNDTFRGLGGADTFTGGSGADLYQWQWKDVVDSATGAHLGVDRVTDLSSADSLDLRSLVGAERQADGTSGVPVEQDPNFNIDDYVHLVDGAEGTALQVRHNGEFVDVVLLEGIHGVDTAQYWASDGLILV